MPRLARRVLFFSLALLAAPAVAEPPLLKPELEKLAAASADRLPEEMRQKFAQGIEQVRGSGVLDKAANVGDPLPRGVLFDAQGNETPVQSLWAEGPVVLTFYRGGWCPYCSLQLQNLQKSVAALEGAGARVVAIAPEAPAKVGETVAKHGLSFQVLSDRHNALAKKLGISFKLPQVILPIYRDMLHLAEYNEDEEYTLPLAATYVVDSQGVIRYAFIDADYKKRAEPRDVVAALKKL